MEEIIIESIENLKKIIDNNEHFFRLQNYKNKEGKKIKLKSSFKRQFDNNENKTKKYIFFYLDKKPKIHYFKDSFKYIKNQSKKNKTNIEIISKMKNSNLKTPLINFYKNIYYYLWLWVNKVEEDFVIYKFKNKIKKEINDSFDEKNFFYNYQKNVYFLLDNQDWEKNKKIKKYIIPQKMIKNIRKFLSDKDFSNFSQINDSKKIYLDSKEILSYYNKGIISNYFNKPKEAIEWFQKVTQIKHDFLEAHYNKAISFVSLAKFEEAKDCLSKIDDDNKFEFSKILKEINKINENSIIELKNKLNFWSKNYYEKNKSIVSDAKYDGKYKKLLNIEKIIKKNNLNFIDSNSITQKVGGKIDNRFQKIEHEFPMLSLGNAFNKEDLLKFDKQIKDALHVKNDIQYVLEYKIDGLSISIKYENGKLYKAITRGDGLVGEDVTHNVKTIKDIPLEIDYKNSLEVRGEIYMSNNIFNELNKNNANLSNPRNAASGTIRQLNSEIAEKRKLSAFLYSVPNPINHNIFSHKDILNFLKKNKINTNDKTMFAKNMDEVIKFIEILSKKRDDLPYIIDGIVIKVNNINFWEDIGNTVKFPKYMIAYKFPAEIVETKLLQIFPTVGRTGKITYNADLYPVKLSGSLVSAATLHNSEYIEKLQINIGDIVKIKKAGDIIPKVLGVYIKNNNEIWHPSEKCPSCNFELIKKPEEVDQYCGNENCFEKQISKLEHFVSKGAINIEGLSSETLKTFMNKKIISDIPSIFKLKDKKEEILNLHGFKEKSVNKLLNAIDKSKTLELNKFIFSLGIRYVGAKNSKILAKRLGSLKNFYNTNVESLEIIRDIGDKVSKSIINFFSKEKNKKLIQELLSSGFKIKEMKLNFSNKFSNLTFVITGTLSNSRKYFVDIIESFNGNVSNTITSKTNYLLIGKNVGSKLKKAKELNIKIINEDSFNEMTKEKNE